MIDEAVSMLGRFARKVLSDDDTTDHGLPIAQMADDEPDAPPGDCPAHAPEAPEPSSSPSSGTVVAVPELTHPGESASNGLAERSVRTIEEFSRTLITALQTHIRVPLTMAHPLCHWAIQHAAYLLNKYRLDKDGHTAYGRLHGKETREHPCELGEKVLWFVPKALRAKADQPWRYGICLGRSLGSDQNFIGLPSGDVVRARAMVRLTVEARWDAQRLLAIKMTPLNEHTRWLDKLEAREAPHSFDAAVTDSDTSQAPWRTVRIAFADLKKYGFSDICPRRACHQTGSHARAKHHRHSETCRARIYQALRDDDASKVRSAPPERTSTSLKSILKKKTGDATASRDGASKDSALPSGKDSPLPAHDVPNSDDDISRIDPADFGPDVPADAAPRSPDLCSPSDLEDDTTDFFKVVDADRDMVDNARLLEDDHSMFALLDVLQCLGVDVEVANRFASSICRKSPDSISLRLMWKRRRLSSLL